MIVLTGDMQDLLLKRKILKTHKRGLGLVHRTGELLKEPYSNSTRAGLEVESSGQGTSKVAASFGNECYSKYKT